MGRLKDSDWDLPMAKQRPKGMLMAKPKATLTAKPRAKQKPTVKYLARQMLKEKHWAIPMGFRTVIQMD